MASAQHVAQATTHKLTSKKVNQIHRKTHQITTVKTRKSVGSGKMEMDQSWDTAFLPHPIPPETQEPYTDHLW